MSLAVRQSMLLVALIQHASFGADQLSLGITEPPRVAIASLIWVCVAAQAWEGSGSGGSDSADEWEETDVGGVRGGELAEEGCQSSSSSSGGRMMPSARR